MYKELYQLCLKCNEALEVGDPELSPCYVVMVYSELLEGFAPISAGVSEEDALNKAEYSGTNHLVVIVTTLHMVNDWRQKFFIAGVDEVLKGGKLQCG
jgi:hypothetical protein